MSQTLGPIGKPTESPQSSKTDKRCSHGMSAIDGGNAEIKVEYGVAELVGMTLGEFVGALGIAFFDQRLDIIGGRRNDRLGDGESEPANNQLHSPEQLH